MKFEIPLKLPSLNDYIKVCRTNKYMAAKFKSDIEKEIGLYLINMPRYENPIKINFTWIEGNKKRDLDNVCYAKKHILDAMVKYKKIKDDNRKIVTAFTDTFKYSNDGVSKVIIEIEEIKELN